MNCNCENSKCDHGGADGKRWRPCSRSARGFKRIEMLGPVCDTCWSKYPSRYRQRVKLRGSQVLGRTSEALGDPKQTDAPLMRNVTFYVNGMRNSIRRALKRIQRSG